VTLSFLADENISPESADHLRSLGYPCHSLLHDGPRSLSDRQIADLAKREGLVILTHDLDFGEIYYFSERAEIGVLVLRLREQTVESVNGVLERFLHSDILSDQEIRKALIILSETSYRVYRGPRGEF